MGYLTVLYIFFVFFAALFGIVIGSFLNVVIYRVPEGKTISKGHSMCMSCGHTLAAKDLVPLFSWLALKGKCRYCGAPVASRYAKIESLTGAVYLLAALLHKEIGLWVLNEDHYYIYDLIYYALFVIASSATIATMMIYHDTGKGFPGLALYTLVPGVLSTLLLTLYTKDIDPVFSLKYTTCACVISAIFVIACRVSAFIARSEYTKADLGMDMAFAGMMLFAQYLWMGHYKEGLITYASYCVFYMVFRRIMKGKAGDRYTGIVSAAVIVILMIIRYFI